MKYLILLAALFSQLAFAQVTSHTARHIRWGAVLPANCRVTTGDVFFKTQAPNVGMHFCSAANTWTYLDPSGGISDIDDLTNQDSWATAATKITNDLTFSGVEADFNAGASNAWPKLLTETAPTGTDCDEASEYGRLLFDDDQDTNGSVMVCTSAGWKDVDDDGGAGGFVSFDIDGDNNSPQTITDGNEALFVGGDGIDTTAAVTDQITFDVDSSEADFLNSGALTCGVSTQGKMQVHTTPLQYCDNAATPALQYAAYGASDGDALAGDSATAFFDTGTIEAARLPEAAADDATKGIATFDATRFSCVSGNCDIASVAGITGSTEDDLSDDAVTALSSYATTSGTGSTALLSTITTPATNDFLSYSAGGNWVNSSPNAGTDLTADLEEEAHASEHQHGGGDEVATATPGANAIPKAEADGDLNAGFIGQDQNYTWTGQFDHTGSEILGATALRFEGLTDNNIYTQFAFTDPTTSSKTMTFQDASGIVVINSNAINDFESGVLAVAGGALDVGGNTITATHVDETGVFAFSNTGNTFVGASYTSGAADPADGGVLRAGNAEDVFCAELAIPGVDPCLQLDASDLWQLDGTLNVATTITEGGNAVRNTSELAAGVDTWMLTPSVANLATALTDEDFTPGTNHASRHQNGGADEVATATPGANAIPKAEADGDINSGWIPLDAGYTWTGTHDFGGTIIEIQNGTAAPLATDCDADAERGRIYQKTDATSGQQLYLCEGLANGWVLQGDGGGTPDIDDLTNQDSWATAATKITNDLTFSGVEADFNAGASNAWPKLLTETTPTATDCDAAAEYGRLLFDDDQDTNGSVMVCTSAGWKDVDDDGAAGGTPGGATGDVQFNDGASGFAGEAAFNYTIGSDLLSLTSAVDGDYTALAIENSQAHAAASTNETATIQFEFATDPVAQIQVGKEDDYDPGPGEDDSFLRILTDRDGTLTEAWRFTSAGDAVIGGDVIRTGTASTDSAINFVTGATPAVGIQKGDGTRAYLTADNVEVNAGGYFRIGDRTKIRAPAGAQTQWQNNAETAGVLWDFTALTASRTITLPDAAFAITATPTANASPLAGAGSTLAAGWVQEVLALADLTDVASTTGSGTAAVLGTNPTLTDVTVNDLLTFTESAGDSTCAAGDYDIKGNSSTGKLRGCENGTLFDLNTAGGSTHDLLSATHTDTTAAAVSRGSLVVGQTATPAWQELVIGGAGTLLSSDGTDATWGVNYSATSSANVIAQAEADGDLNAAFIGQDQDYTWTSTNQDFSGVTNFTVPVGSVTPTVNGTIAYDSSQLRLEYGSNGQNRVVVNTAEAQTLTQKTIDGVDAGAATTRSIENKMQICSHDTDVTSLTDGVARELCWEEDSDALYICDPSAGGCDTPGEWTQLNSGGGTHDILSATHTDTTPAAVSRGSLIVGQTATPVWQELTIGGANTFLTSDGTDATWGTATLASAQFANQGTTTTVLHGNAAGNPSFAQVDLTSTVTGVLPEANLPDATSSAQGVVELAINTEVNTGTDTTRAITPDALANSNYAPSGTETLTNKTLDAEGTGNTLTTVSKIWLPTAACPDGTTAGLLWDAIAAEDPAAACVNETTPTPDRVFAVAQFDDDQVYGIQINWMIPSDWTGNVDLKAVWRSDEVTGDVVWQSQTFCAAAAEATSGAWNTADAFPADTTDGTANDVNTVTDTAITMTGCAAGELLFLRVFRDAAHASDTLATLVDGVADLIGIEMTIRRAQ